MPVIPIEFALFAFTLIGIAVFHRRTLEVALGGLVTIVLYQLLVTSFKTGPGVGGLLTHLRHEWVVLANLGLLLPGFAVLAAHFQQSGVPRALPRLLPSDWTGPFWMLTIVFVLSSFLDNIAAALIGGTMASSLFARVHIGYIAAIVAASNAGGSGSVIGDTTTTMMWIDGVSPADVLHAYVGAATALLVCGIPAARQQHQYSPLVRSRASDVGVDWARATSVLLVLAAAVVVNITVNVKFPRAADGFPFLGVGVWIALLLSAAIRPIDWKAARASSIGTVFLLSLVLSASLMPVERLPSPSVRTTLGLGFLSAVFDNIPLTALALDQGGYDWGFLAYSVGFGGSMIWFGSSAGVAISNLFPHARSAGLWLQEGWHVTLAYVTGFIVMVSLLGWHPS